MSTHGYAILVGVLLLNSMIRSLLAWSRLQDHRATVHLVIVLALVVGAILGQALWEAR